MLSAGVSPAFHVRSSSRSNVPQSIVSCAVNGSRTAEMPSIFRHGIIDGITPRCPPGGSYAFQPDFTARISMAQSRRLANGDAVARFRRREVAARTHDDRVFEV